MPIAVNRGCSLHLTCTETCIVKFQVDMIVNVAFLSHTQDVHVIRVHGWAMVGERCVWGGGEKKRRKYR